MRSLLNQDVWTCIGPFMFGEKRASTYSFYTDGMAATQRGYTELIQHVINGTYPKSKPMYFQLGEDDANIGEISFVDNKRVYTLHDYSESPSSYVLDPDDEDFTKLENHIRECLHKSKNPKRKPKKLESKSDDPYYNQMRSAIKNNLLSVVHQIFVKTSDNRHFLSVVPSGPRLLPFLRYFFHYGDSTMPTISLWTKDHYSFPYVSEKHHETMFRAIWWNIWRNNDQDTNEHLSRMFKIAPMCWSENIDNITRENYKWEFVLTAYEWSSTNIYLDLHAEYLLVRYQKRNPHLWETIQNNYITLNYPCAHPLCVWDGYDVGTDDMSLISQELGKIIRACVMLGYVEILEKIDVHMKKQLEIHSIDKDYFYGDMQRFILDEVSMYSELGHSLVTSLAWIRINKPHWLYD